MKPQIVHEAEIHRQHVRLRVPIAVEIDGTRYSIDDWSMGGFGVAGPITSRRDGERFAVRMIFPFEDFDLSLRLEAQMIYILPDLPRFGARFVALTQGQLALFRYIVDAYLSGEIVSGGDILSVVGSDQAGEARVQKLFSALNEEDGWGRQVRRLVGIGLMTVAGIGLASLLVAGLYQKYLVVATDRAVIEAPVYRLTAPASGVVQAGSGGLLRRGDPAMRLIGADGAVVEVPSPCECVLGEWIVPPGAPVQAGAAVATLVAADQPLTVRADVALADAKRLRVGQAAEISVPGKSETYRGRVEAIDFRLTARRPGEQVDLRAAERMSVPVIVRPERPFDFEHLGYAVSVTFL